MLEDTCENALWCSPRDGNPSGVGDPLGGVVLCAVELARTGAPISWVKRALGEANSQSEVPQLGDQSLVAFWWLEEEDVECRDIAVQEGVRLHEGQTTSHVFGKNMNSLFYQIPPPSSSSVNITNWIDKTDL